MKTVMTGRRMQAWSVIGASVAMILAAASVRAAESQQQAPADRSATISIPAGSLDRSLQAYAEAMNVQLVYAPELVAGLRSRGLSGAYGRREALELLLNESGLTFRFVNERTVTLERAPQPGTRTLGPVRVEGADQTKPVRGEGTAQLGGIRGGQDQEARGLRPVTAAVGAGSPMAIEDVPRSVSVLTQAQMEAQDVQDLGEAVRRMPGLSMIQTSASSAASSSGAQVYSRGFRIDTVQIDGGAPRGLDMVRNGLLDLNAYERIELVRGANGAFAGTESPGGSLNLVRKRPGGAPMLDVALTAGTDERYQGTVDWSTPSLLDSPVAFRGVASYEDQQFPWDNDRLKRTSLYGIFDLPLGDRARLELGAQYQDVNEKGLYTGSYRYYDGPNVDAPFYFNVSPDWTFLNSETVELFSRFYVRLLDDWNLDIGVNYSNVEKSSLDAYVGLFVLSTTQDAFQICRNGTCTRRASRLIVSDNFATAENLGTDFRVSGQFETWGLTHNVTLLGDFNALATTDGRLQWGETTWPGLYALSDFLRLPDAAAPPRTNVRPPYDPDFKYTSSQWGLTVADEISWRDRAAVILSARRSDSEFSSGKVSRRASDGVVYDVRIDDDFDGTVNRAPEWHPSYAARFSPLRDVTVYGSYSQGFEEPQPRYTPSGEQLGATTYKNIEYGVKYGVADWLLTASRYTLKQEGVAVEIPGTQGQCGPKPNSYCYFGGGVSIESTGYELEAVGRFLNQLDVALSYTDNRTVNKPSDLPFDTRSPEKLVKASLGWDVPWIPSLTLNAGAVYTGAIFEQGTRRFYDPVTYALVAQLPYAFAEESTLIWDLGASYRVNDNVQVALLVENVSDTEYYSTVGSSTNYIGNPRTAMLKVTWRDAGDRSGYTASPTTGLAPFGDPGDWYGSFDVGQQRPEDWKAHSTGRGVSGETVKWKFETSPAEAFYARLGYRLNDRWRTEGEIGFRQHGFGKVGGNSTVPYGLCGVSYASAYIDTPEDRMTHCYDPQGEGQYWSFMANLIRDFGAPSNRLRPYLGLGLGATRASVDFSGRLDGYRDESYRAWYQQQFGSSLPVAPGETAFGSDTSWGLTYQVLAGVSWRVTDRATLDVNYKFIHDELDVKTANVKDYYPYDGWPTPLVNAGLPPLGSFKGDLNSHAFTVGLRWAFGAPSAH
ncbi:TonB-dependent receptor domain-containing protein [Steroidobacter flavus]|uniref:TonB-dependent receptor domain-containing protein n=1 Tax=Steroidobacter flavus TaxID=1842136 RepID=A0ABV8T3J0_9GAMM